MISAASGESPGVAAADIAEQLAEALDTLRAIRCGEVDALVVADGSPGSQVFTLTSADRPYRLFVEAMRDGVATVSEVGIVLYANDALAELVGQSRSRIIAAPLISLVGERHRDALAAHNGSAGTGAAIEIELIGADDLAIPVRVAAATLDVDGERLVCLTFVDLTQIKRDQRELADAHARAVESSRLKSQFVANMSHEIRTPLNGVLGMIGLMSATGLTDEQREYIQAMGISGDALLTVVDQILDFSKLEAGKLELEVAAFSPRAMVEEVCSIVAVAAHAKGHELLAWVDPELPMMVTGDCTRVRRVLINLMSNAVKFSTDGEICVQVTGSQEGSRARIRIEVTDTGIGVSPDSVERIFQSFSQADGSTTRQYGGTGLGLAISKQLVELMGGEIGVDSVEGRGSTFWFTLLAEAVADNEAAGLFRPELAGVRVLAVDDNASSRDLLQRLLLGWGMTCQTAPDGQTALGMLASAEAIASPYDLLVIDAGMPGMSGTELTRAIRHAPSWRQMPILLLITSETGRAAGRHAGADGYVSKPVRQKWLYDAIAQVLHLLPPQEALVDELGPLPAPDADAVRPPAKAVAPSGSDDDRNDREEYLVLLVEDNAMNQLVAVRMLEKRGFRVDVAVNGRVALEMWRHHPYRAVFMDCQMPELDGYETTAEIRRREGSAGDHVPIIAMTASTMKGDREKCLLAGMDDYVSKPVDPAALNEAIARALG